MRAPTDYFTERNAFAAVFVIVLITFGVADQAGAHLLEAGGQRPGMVQIKLEASDGEVNDVFGDGAAIQGNVAMVGAPSGDMTKPGSVYVFGRQEGQLVEKQKLDPSDGIPGDRFGQSIAIRGDLAVIGSMFATYDNRGAAYIFREDGTEWVEEQKLTASDAAPADNLGRTVTFGEDMAIAGAPFHDHSDENSGSVYVYRFSGGEWIEVQEILAPDGAADDHFGSSLAWGERGLFIGASGDDNYTGSAYFYRFNGMEWVYTQKLIAPDGVAGDGFGVSVTVDDDMALIGSTQVLSSGTGNVNVFQWNGEQWIWRQKLISSDAELGDKFGLALDAQDGIAVIGAPFEGENGSWAGAVYVFRFNGLEWIERLKILAADGSTLDNFGTTVGVSGRVALVGAPLAEGAASFSGVAFIVTRR